MTTDLATPPSLLAPVAWLGRQTLAAAGYLGGLAVLAASALRATFRPASSDPPFLRAVGDELGWMFGMGLPLVALVHVGMGSFLAMQSYFGGTFVEGTGAVVGVGLFRNVAPQTACLTLAGLLAARVIPQLRARPDPEAVGRPVAALLAASAVAGVVLSVWGAAVGTVVGWNVGKTLMGVSTHMFFLMFWDMLWSRDVVGVVGKGAAFGLFSGLFACHEAVRGPADAGLPAASASACRAACLSALAILVINSGWFIVLYHAGPAFGPTLLQPPTP